MFNASDLQCSYIRELSRELGADSLVLATKLIGARAGKNNLIVLLPGELFLAMINLTDQKLV